ncbi:hypothetical protein WDL1P1_00454 (plasmid) [Variovorax sp. WDL1]|nr:hypothetical protein WDL1P1_00454 [Variovorax sp. WDL1]
MQQNAGMKLLLTLACALAAFHVASASAADEASELKALVERQNSQCRGGSGGDPKTMAACDDRTATMAKLKRLGWCWVARGRRHTR